MFRRNNGDRFLYKLIEDMKDLELTFNIGPHF